MPEAPSLLLVDDEPGILSALARSLRREGYRLVSAEGPHEALRALRAQPFDAVLTDYKMPGMNGIELLRRVAECRPEAARLVLTGWPAEIPPGDLEAVGVAALLSKPWRDAELKAALREALAAQSA